MALTTTAILSYVLFLTIAGYFLPYASNKRVSRGLAWFIAVVTICFSTAITADESAFIRMLVIVFLQLVSMKIVVVIEAYSGENKLKFHQWLAFSLGWFGMRPVLFEKLPSTSLSFHNYIWKGLSRITAGFGLVYLSWLIEQCPMSTMFFIPQLVLLAGVSLILHFGILNLSVAQWRMMGVDVSELFRSPYRAKSLKEFWGKRWNVAFSEMTALIAYRPLKEKIGIQNAVIVSFLLSGILHEIAISFPVRSGYGLPMLYFAIHAIAMQREAKSKFIQRVIQHQVYSHVWVMALLILPMPLLFHAEFIRNVLIELRTFLIGNPAMFEV